jgi:hypothetical protein
MQRLISTLSKAIRSNNTSRAAGRSARRAQPQLEALETRDLLSGSPLYGALLIPADVDPIQAKYKALGRTRSPLGNAVTVELATPYGSGRYERFEYGAIFWSAATGAHNVSGPVADEFFLTANEKDASGQVVQKNLGLPTADETSLSGVSGARVSQFQGGTIYWSPWSGAHVLYGPIAAKYAGVGGPAAYGLPISDEADLPGVPGERVTYFQPAQGGRAIYWSAATGAHLVYGVVGAEYVATANERGMDGLVVQKLLGAPTSDEMNVPGVPGARMNTFQGGTIYFSGSTGAHVVYGAIGAKYMSLGGPTSFLGLPTGDEQSIPGGRACYYQHGKILLTAQGGMQVVSTVPQMTFNTGPITFGSLVAADGYGQLTVSRDGSFSFTGHFHDSGLADYNDSLVMALVSPSGVCYTFTHTGHVSGSASLLFGSGSRDDDWPSSSGQNAALAAGWADLQGCKLYWRSNVNVDWQSLLNDIKQAAGVVTSIVSIVT